MNENVKALTTKTFDNFVAKGKVVVDFWAEWCGPCKILSPIIAELAKENKNISFGAVNVEEEYDLSEKFEVVSIPTLLFFKDGKLIDQTVGALPKDALKDKIEEIF